MRAISLPSLPRREGPQGGLKRSTASQQTASGCRCRLVQQYLRRTCKLPAPCQSTPFRCQGVSPVCRHRLQMNRTICPSPQSSPHRGEEAGLRVIHSLRSAVSDTRTAGLRFSSVQSHPDQSTTIAAGPPAGYSSPGNHAVVSRRPQNLLSLRAQTDDGR